MVSTAVADLAAASVPSRGTGRFQGVDPVVTGKTTPRVSVKLPQPTYEPAAGGVSSAGR